MRNAVILLACLLGVVVMAGCGGDGGGNGSALSKEDYEQQMQALQADLEATAEPLQEAFANPQDLPAVANGLNETADLFDQASTDLDGVEPPEDVADPHQAMVDNTAGAADKMRDIADTVENGSAAEAQEALASFQTLDELTELQEAVDDIKAAGYDIGGSD